MAAPPGPAAFKTVTCAATVFREVASGAKTTRIQLRKAIASLGAGDVLVVTRLDRLARSTRDLLNTLAAITDRKAGFRSLSEAWADTTTSHGRLMLTVLGGLAEFERDLIRARTSEGRERARARGVRMGARPSSPHTSGERHSGAATAAPRRWRTSPGATTSARRQFRGSGHEAVSAGALNRSGASLAGDRPHSHAPEMFVVSEAEAAAIRGVFHQQGEFAAAMELRRLFPGITDAEQAREYVRTIAGWRPLPRRLHPTKTARRQELAPSPARRSWCWGRGAAWR